ncbi:unnamed protein product [marine sediment metagenome]|uniref:Uncharacterized protein n=1 Tax=marine sediment metagenome TaxID=412755 RepID=X1ITY4_9ZZZZ
MSSNADKKQLSEKQDFEVTEKMETDMEARLAAVRADDVDELEDGPPSKKKEEEKEVKDEEKEVEEEAKEEEEEKEVVKDEKEEVKEEEKEETEEEKVKDDKKVEYVLPENYFQSMRHVGWTPEQIKETFERDPEPVFDQLC